MNQHILGYSGPAHYVFFRNVILACPWIKNMLVLGVYHGRDIAFMEDVIAHHCPERKIQITGIDTFTDTPQLDWPKDAKSKTWQEAGFGTPPSLENARANTKATIVQASDADFMRETTERFDFIYVDTSHDEPTVARQLQQCPSVCKANALIAGDDYDERPNWGVISAVRKACLIHGVFAGGIWFTDCNKIRRKA